MLQCNIWTISPGFKKKMNLSNIFSRFTVKVKNRYPDLHVQRTKMWHLPKNWHKNCTEPGMCIQRPIPTLAAGILVILTSGLTAPAQAMPTKPTIYEANSKTCRQAVHRTERALRLPTGIMQAISLAESGRWDKSSRSHFAWPWTVMAHGKGRFYPSKAAAIAAVRKLQADGLKNIDVGCMQVNLKYHPKAFDSLEDAFDPAINARYAAGLFAKLRKANKSIIRAVAHYHSTTRARNRPYTKKVVRLWNQERRRFFAEEREKKLAAWRAVREQRKAAKLAKSPAARKAAQKARTLASAGAR